LIQIANEIIDEYQQQGFSLTLRQLYYQFVARDHIENTIQSYKRLGGIINDARLAGLIDWEAIEDRTRAVEQNSHWNSPGEIVEACASQFRVDLWANQKYRPEVWIEKEALAGVIEPICRKLDIPWLSCRGYTSQSVMWECAMRLRQIADSGQTPMIFHFGDHDPSGIDMTRDIVDRLNMFSSEARLERLALNWDQIEEYKPPPNPAKVTDSRFRGYMLSFGEDSWELDALEPKELIALIEYHITKLQDPALWADSIALQNRHRDKLRELSQQI